jgi:hypothetical protein
LHSSCEKHILSVGLPHRNGAFGTAYVQTIILILVALVGLIFLLIVRVLVQMTGSAAAVPREKSAVPTMQSYLALRDRVLQGSRQAFGLAAGATIAEPWGVVVDMVIENGFVSVAALSDGGAGIYLSGGASIARGRSQKSVREAARLTVEAAKPCRPMMRATDSFPLPDAGEVAFYVLTDAGVFAAIVSEEQLRTTSHLFTRLAAAAQDVITQYRLSQQLT